MLEAGICKDLYANHAANILKVVIVKDFHKITQFEGDSQERDSQKYSRPNLLNGFTTKRFTAAFRKILHFFREKR